MPPIQIRIDLGRRNFWLLGRKSFRRDLPTSFQEVPAARRLVLLRYLIQHPEQAGRIKAMQHLLRIPPRIFKGLNDLDIAALLDLCPWLAITESPAPILPEFTYRRTRYIAPAAHGLNLVGLEYPIADEAFEKYMKTGDIEALNLLIGTLYREQNYNEQAVARRGDERLPLLSRWEAEGRAITLAGAPVETKVSALLYFAGVKQYINKAYGQHLFEQPDDDDAPLVPSTTPGLGWWGVYFNLAIDGPFGRNVEDVYQTSFHDICLYLVERKRQQERSELDRRMNESDFGISNP